MNRSLRRRILLLLTGVIACGAGFARGQNPGTECDSLKGCQNAYEAGYRAGYEAGYRAGRAEGGSTAPNGQTGLRTGNQTGKNSPLRFGNTSTNRFGAEHRNLGQKAFADDNTSGRRFMHRLGAEFRPEYISPTNPFLRGENNAGLPIDLALSGHLRYAFQFRPGSTPDRIYGGAYQGLGVAYYDFQRPDELGNPVALYLFQGARIARLAPRLTFDYEWNFGLSFGWQPYDLNTNPNNKMMGSKINAYLNVDLLLRWRVLREVDLTAKYILYQKSLQKFSGAISICIIFFYTNSISLITILFSQCVFTLVILIRTACATTGSASGTKTVSPASLSPAEVHGIVYSTPSSAQAPV